jgi:hypothetical protein
MTSLPLVVGPIKSLGKETFWPYKQDEGGAPEDTPLSGD